MPVTEDDATYGFQGPLYQGAPLHLRLPESLVHQQVLNKRAVRAETTAQFGVSDRNATGVPIARSYMWQAPELIEA